MKQYLLSFLVVAMAIGFSAFSTLSSSPTTDTAFWYKIDPTNNNEVLQELGFVSRETAEGMTDCDGIGTLCGHGYSSDLYNVGDNATQATQLVIRERD